MSSRTFRNCRGSRARSLVNPRGIRPRELLARLVSSWEKTRTPRLAYTVSCEIDKSAERTLLAIKNSSNLEFNNSWINSIEFFFEGKTRRSSALKDILWSHFRNCFLWVTSCAMRLRLCRLAILPRPRATFLRGRVSRSALLRGLISKWAGHTWCQVIISPHGSEWTKGGRARQRGRHSTSGCCGSVKVQRCSPCQFDD